MSYIGQTLPADSFQGFTTDSFTGDGSATTFTLSKTPFNESALLVVINNVVQKPTTNFTVSGTTLTIVGTAVASGDVIYATHIGGALPIGQAASLDLNGASDQLILDADADTTISADTDDQIDFKVGGTDEMTLSSTGLVINEGSNDRDFRVESNGNANMLFVDGGNNVVRVGSSSHTNSLITNNHELVVGDESSGASGIAILAPNDENSYVSFFDPDNSGSFRGSLNYNHSSDFLRTYVNGSERMRIESDGGVCIGQTTTSSMLAYTQSANSVSTANTVTNTSYSNHQNYWQNATNGTTSFNFLICISNTASSNDTEFRIQGSGATQSDGSYTGTGVDFGEYFEWADGNSSDEVRYGYSVVLDGNKIRKATAEDTTSDIIGIISAHPTIIGDGDIDKWNKKYLRDDFNKSIMEEYTLTTWTETTYDDSGSASPTENIGYHTDNIPDGVTVPSEDVKDSEGRVIKTKAVVTSTDENGNKLKRKKLNPDWDSSKTYIPREERKEWDVVGLVGKLRMHKGQPTNPNWRKMRDISDTVEEWLVR